MATEWVEGRWGDLATLEYGRSLRGYKEQLGRYRVYGTNGPIGNHDAFLVKHPTVIIGRKGAYRGVHYSPDPCFVIDTAFYLKPTANIDIRWAYYQLLTQDINGMDSGSAVPSTSRPEFYQLPVKIPPLPEQRTIATILGTLDDRIELNRRMGDTINEMAHTLFKSWFINFDPVRAKADGHDTLLPAHLSDLFPNSLVDSTTGPIPSEWHIYNLDVLATFVNGLALQKFPPAHEGSLPIIKIAQLRSGSLQGADFASANLDPRYIVDDGDILFSWSGSLECRIWASGRGALNQHLFKVVPNGQPKWLCYFAILRHLSEFREVAAGKATTMGHIQRHHLRDAKLAIPSEHVLKRMDAIMSPILGRSIAAALEVNRLRQLRDTLLPLLVSGQLQVHIEESHQR